MTDQRPVTVYQATRSASSHAARIVPALIAESGKRAPRRFLEFFAANIRNPHTRRACGHAVAAFPPDATIRACRQSPLFSRFTEHPGSRHRLLTGMMCDGHASPAVVTKS